jgi:hypothetical protein
LPGGRSVEVPLLEAILRATRTARRSRGRHIEVYDVGIPRPSVEQCLCNVSDPGSVSKEVPGRGHGFLMGSMILSPSRRLLRWSWEGRHKAVRPKGAGRRGCLSMPPSVFSRCVDQEIKPKRKLAVGIGSSRSGQKILPHETPWRQKGVLSQSTGNGLQSIC